MKSPNTFSFFAQTLFAIAIIPFLLSFNSKIDFSEKTFMQNISIICLLTAIFFAISLHGRESEVRHNQDKGRDDAFNNRYPRYPYDKNYMQGYEEAQSMKK